MKSHLPRLVLDTKRSVPGVYKCEDQTEKLKNNTTIRINGEEILVRWNDLMIIDHLGTGCFGVVYRMKLKKDPPPAEPLVFAVKEINLIRTEIKQQNILKESEFGTRIENCSYAVRTFGFLKHSHTVRIIMEIMDYSIANVCDMIEIIPEDKVIYIANCVIKGLDILSEVYKIQHRDVKPSNILVNRSGNVKICDYGVSARMTRNITYTANVGTYVYQAPERHDLPSNIEGYDIKSDVWSLGLTLYKIITGELPFDLKLDEIEYAAQVLACSDIQLPDNLECSSKGLRELVAHCLRKDKDARLNYKELLELDVFTELDLEDEKQRFAEFICNLPLN